jgi:formate dehydrogenase subunit gamma
MSTAIAEGEIERYTYRERLCHWLTGFSYLYSLATGLAFYSPHLFWMAVVLGGGPTSRFWHPIVSLAFVAGVLWMHAIWRGDMKITANDRDWLRNVKYYIENQEDLVPPAGRFNAGQKEFYWMMYYGALLLVASGLLLWFPEYIPRGLAWIRPLAIVLHECAALVTIGAFIIHIYMGLFLVIGGLRPILTGSVSRQWARTHHLLWYREVTGDVSAEK